MLRIENAKQKPEVYFGLHMVPGVAEYRDPGTEPYRIYLSEETTKKMDRTFQGRPLYVQHVDEVDLKNLQAEADGYVINSFYNPVDGMHWAKFIVVSDAGHGAIKRGWQLSNSYFPKAFTGGGQCHGVDYVKEVTDGEYEHLALVPNPRYEESIILTPDEFKEYNANKEAELQRIANSKEKEGEQQMGLNFFKKAKVENADLETTMVVLPKSKHEFTIAQLVNEMDDYRLTMKEPQMANGDHHVMVGEKKMTVNELINSYMDMCKNAEGKEVEEKQNDEEADADDDAIEKEKQSAVGDKAEKVKEKVEEVKEKKEDSDDEASEEIEAPVGKKKNSKANLEALKNADKVAMREELNNVPFADLSDDKVIRGKSRYGSN